MAHTLQQSARTSSDVGQEHIQDKGLDITEKRDEERLSHVVYSNARDEVHPLELTKEYKMARWKRFATFIVDVCVTGMGMLLYFLAYLDKANLGNAKVAGLETDLKLTGYQYSVALTVLYPSYMAVELPSNLLLKKLGPHRVLPFMTVAFGLVCCLQGQINSYGGLLAARFFLGAAEGGLIPGIIMWVSGWYKRSEMQLRLAWIFSFISLAGAFAGLLAAAILTLDGVHGVAGWRWVFYIEGAAAIGVGLVAPFIMSANVSTAWFLSAKEKEMILTIHEASGKNAEIKSKFSKKEVFSFLKAPMGLGLLPAFLTNGCILFGMSYFLPTVIATFGYSRIQTQLHTVPIYAVVFVSKAEQKNFRYAALFLQIFGGPGLTPALSTWMVDNVAPYYKRSTGIACAYIFAQAGGILSTWIFPTEEAPLYPTGRGVGLFSALSLILTGACLSSYAIITNRKKAAFMASAGPDYVFPDGPMDDSDPRYRYMP
ncbi:MFS general substrate transporter [Cystobasidium minutum MCA 4210]|uniref:MFS general substrate transporter n=1 Tax=Cystobasidium minutum MCA 4210 TaxID=1397322 RepID=UPI0034CD35D8|eukprot:jgi/Rhomi1/202462/MIX3291_75_77